MFNCVFSPAPNTEVHLTETTVYFAETVFVQLQTATQRPGECFLFFKFIFTGRFVLFHFHVICLGVIRQAVIDHLLRLLNYNTLVQKAGYMSLRLPVLCYQFQTIIIIIMEQAYCRMLLSLRPIHKDPVQINPQPLFLSTIFSMIVLSQPMPYFTWPNWLSFWHMMMFVSQISFLFRSGRMSVFYNILHHPDS